MASSRGPQFGIVVPLSAGALLPKFKAHRSLLYVAMTRAEDLLVILHSGQPAYIDERNCNFDVRSEAELR